MEIAQDQIGAVSVLAPVGRLDTDSATDLELALADLIAIDARHFVIDFSRIGYVSSAGLRVLLMTAKQLEGGKGTMRLCGLNPQVKQVFDVAGFTKLFQLFTDRAAALDKHPHLAEAAPQMGKLASRLMGAKVHQPDVDSAEADVARRAASLLGAKPAQKAAVAKAVPAAAGGTDRAMALQSLKTPLAPAARGATTVQADKPRGFFARLLGMFRK